MVFHRASNSFYYYDSLPGYNNRTAEKTGKKIHALLSKEGSRKHHIHIPLFSARSPSRTVVQREHGAHQRPERIFPAAPFLPHFTAAPQFVTVTTPRQGNGYDCGVYVLALSEILGKRLSMQPAGVTPKPGDLGEWNVSGTLKEAVGRKRAEVRTLVEQLTRWFQVAPYGHMSRVIEKVMNQTAGSDMISKDWKECLKCSDCDVMNDVIIGRSRMPAWIQIPERWQSRGQREAGRAQGGGEWTFARASACQTEGTSAESGGHRIDRPQHSPRLGEVAVGGALLLLKTPACCVGCSVPVALRHSRAGTREGVEARTSLSGALWPSPGPNLAASLSLCLSARVMFDDPYSTNLYTHPDEFRRRAPFYPTEESNRQFPDERRRASYSREIEWRETSNAQRWRDREWERDSWETGRSAERHRDYDANPPRYKTVTARAPLPGTTTPLRELHLVRAVREAPMFERAAAVAATPRMVRIPITSLVTKKENGMAKLKGQESASLSSAGESQVSPPVATEGIVVTFPPIPIAVIDAMKSACLFDAPDDDPQADCDAVPSLPAQFVPRRAASPGTPPVSPPASPLVSPARTVPPSPALDPSLSPSTQASSESDLEGDDAGRRLGMGLIARGETNQKGLFILPITDSDSEADEFSHAATSESGSEVDEFDRAKRRRGSVDSDWELL
ncbi:hypothetical protein BDK51DRAFT_45078 [Blyttiomyces helicus]|uniref:Ubiquitin-like protease family profile domain-containing protein n=1 Tax=Blyttiomyces helicus TaxID=388810 RepID=A0A4P9WMR4_9FUNG|nr:hypothetical protein BDK51DRAFT_45078 [Blyttiomyces helicus]|eukprot:RKO92036.1 hypothetical protein BDK51DRAFT_45078 [Blyttiomyces helicus]